MEAINGPVLTFLLNAFWQIPVLIVAAFFCNLVIKNSHARHHHVLWVIVLTLSLLLPLCSALTLNERFPLSWLAWDSTIEGNAPQLAKNGQGLDKSGDWLTDFFQGEGLPIPLASPLSTILVGSYFLFLCNRSVRLWRLWKRTKEIRLAAYSRGLSHNLTSASLRCQSALKSSMPSILYSSSVTVPLTIGWYRPVIILPEHLLQDSAILLSAVGHEIAHIRRRDFLINLICEIVFLPISFHPAAALMRRKINQTREMACDEMVTEHLVDANTYARSLVTIAGSIPSLSRPSYSLGVCGADNLEERIMKLIKRRPCISAGVGRLALTAALIVLAISGATASALSFQVGQGRRVSTAYSDKIVGIWRAMSNDNPDLPSVELAIKKDGDKLAGTATFFEIREKKVAGKQELPLIDPNFDGKTLSFKVRGPGGQLFGGEVTITSENEAEMRRVGDNVPPEMKNQVMKLSRIRQGISSAKDIKGDAYMKMW